MAAGSVVFVAIAEPVADIGAEHLAEVVAVGGGRIQPVHIRVGWVVLVFLKRHLHTESDARNRGQVARETEACTGESYFITAAAAAAIALEHAAVEAAAGQRVGGLKTRSEERRVGKEWQSRW